MSDDELEPIIDDEHIARLVAFDEALALARPTVELLEVPEGQDLAEETKKELAFLRLLQRLRPSRQSAFQTSGGGPDTAVNVFTPPAVLSSGLERFESYREVGGGAFGIVYQAFDKRLHREVALKVPRPGTELTPQVRDRFLREAQAAAALDHPNLVAVHDADASGSSCFIAFAYCPGPTLAQWLQQRCEPLRWDEAMTLMLPLARAVAHAHDRGVVHRDLKPSNVLLCRVGPTKSVIEPGDNVLDLEPKITDFGLAKFLFSQTRALTAAQSIVGTRGYMAPEQAMGRSREVGKPADVYALGAVFYELLTGLTPLEAEIGPESAEAMRSWEPPRPSRLRPGLPKALDWVVLKCLERLPQHRYADAGELMDDLVRVSKSQSVRARPRRWVMRRWRSMCRHPIRVAVVLALAGVLGFGLASGDRLRDLTEPALRSYYGGLQDGHSVTLVAATGGPAWYSEATPDMPLGMTWGKERPLRLHSPNGVGRLELLSDPQHTSYRLSAEILHECPLKGKVEDEKVGVYVGHQEGPRHIGGVYHTLTFADWGRLAGRVGVDAHRRRSPGLNQTSALAKFSEPPKLFDPPQDAACPLWRSLAVEVSLERVAFYWDNKTEPFAVLPREVIDDRLAALSQADHDLGLGEAVPRFGLAPRGALGLYVQYAAAQFRNVIIEPLAGD